MPKNFQIFNKKNEEILCNAVRVGSMGRVVVVSVGIGISTYYIALYLGYDGLRIFLNDYPQILISL